MHVWNNDALVTGGKVTKARRRTIGVLFFTVFVIWVTSFLMRPVAAQTLIWETQVHSSGAEVVSPFLLTGKQYLIVATEMWWYNREINLAADAMYYTNDSSDSWVWVNHFPAPGGGSFLQIDRRNASWGPFSNGEPGVDVGHNYTISYAGDGMSLAFRIVDWIDNSTLNNECFLRVMIYRTITVGGTLVEIGTHGAMPLGIAGVFLVIMSTIFTIRARAAKTQ